MRQGNHCQFKTLSALLTGKSAHALYLWAQSRLLQSFCLSQCFPPVAKKAFLLCTGHEPDCGSTGSLPKGSEQEPLPF